MTFLRNWKKKTFRPEIENGWLTISSEPGSNEIWVRGGKRDILEPMWLLFRATDTFAVVGRALTASQNAYRRAVILGNQTPLRRQGATCRRHLRQESLRGRVDFHLCRRKHHERVTTVLPSAGNQGCNGCGHSPRYFGQDQQGVE